MKEGEFPDRFSNSPGSAAQFRFSSYLAPLLAASNYVTYAYAEDADATFGSPCGPLSGPCSICRLVSLVGLFLMRVYTNRQNIHRLYFWVISKLFLFPSAREAKAASFLSLMLVYSIITASSTFSRRSPSEAHPFTDCLSPGDILTTNH